jgi:hypothetical protein
MTGRESKYNHIFLVVAMLPQKKSNAGIVLPSVIDGRQSEKLVLPWADVRPALKHPGRPPFVLEEQPSLDHLAATSRRTAEIANRFASIRTSKALHRKISNRFALQDPTQFVVENFTAVIRAVFVAEAFNPRGQRGLLQPGPMLNVMGKEKAQ